MGKQARRSRGGQQARKDGGSILIDDPHVRIVHAGLEKTWARMNALVEVTDPVASLQVELDELVHQVWSGTRRFSVLRLLEVARLAYLPFSTAGTPTVDADANPARLELFALVAMSRRRSSRKTEGRADPVLFQEMSQFISESSEKLDDIISISQLIMLFEADSTDQMASISASVRASEILVRNLSYSEALRRTHSDLFETNKLVADAVSEALGFGMKEAYEVLEGCHRLQMEKMNRRMQIFANSLNQPGSAASADELSSPKQIVTDVGAFFEPTEDEASVDVDELADFLQLDSRLVRRVVEKFQIKSGTLELQKATQRFYSGENPMRRRPLVSDESGRFMSLHPTLVSPAVRELLEDELKGGPAWESYARHRGEVLERRTHSALSKMLPHAAIYDSIKFFAPDAKEAELNGSPWDYKKLVETDHLVIIDDVALIVEDKAVAFSALARGGKTARLKSDLTNIISKAAVQANRLRGLIEADGGLVLKDRTWLDLSEIREIHTIAVSLEDLSAVSTTTHQLFDAGLLPKGGVPWTVSTHDLELISELVDQPAVFLLYLRRRCAEDMSRFFFAPDELDLFLHFLDTGLYVEPDPALLRESFPFLPAPKTAEIRRHRNQGTAIITSRTDALDAWYYSAESPGEEKDGSLMPERRAGAIDDLVKDIGRRGSPGWMSVCASLLAMSSEGQRSFLRLIAQMVGRASAGSQSQVSTMAIPFYFSTKVAESWLFVGVAFPESTLLSVAVLDGQEYLRVKRHQMGIPRGALLVFDCGGFLQHFEFDGARGALDPALESKLDALRPLSALSSVVVPPVRKPRRGGKRRR